MDRGRLGQQVRQGRPFHVQGQTEKGHKQDVKAGKLGLFKDFHA